MSMRIIVGIGERGVHKGLPAILLLSCLTAATPGYGQQGTIPNSEAKAPQPASERSKANDVPVSKTGEFYDKDLDLHFHYPVEMRVLDFRAEMETGHQNIYGVSGENDPP